MKRNMSNYYYAHEWCCYCCWWGCGWEWEWGWEWGWGYGCCLAIHQHINVLNSHRTIEPERNPVDWILDFRRNVLRTLEIEGLGAAPPQSGVRVAYLVASHDTSSVSVRLRLTWHIFCHQSSLPLPFSFLRERAELINDPWGKHKLCWWTLLLHGIESIMIWWILWMITARVVKTTKTRTLFNWIMCRCDEWSWWVNNYHLCSLNVSSIKLLHRCIRTHV